MNLKNIKSEKILKISVAKLSEMTDFNYTRVSSRQKCIPKYLDAPLF